MSTHEELLVENIVLRAKLAKVERALLQGGQTPAVRCAEAMLALVDD